MRKKYDTPEAIAALTADKLTLLLEALLWAARLRQQQRETL